ncbi:F0F1 ATP synthase subunit B family protein [Aquibaculum arenosum]|uniref:ATP synthase subunit b n=1 Tax=Aquibaculum arenosum TaxID=3032591 RepID=A0ABT5YQA7_9PROT|nr:ATP F0F1 synthase subunit B [Fodinicurvata sp. CAU 1616]MDF2097146.1 ATP F0F1 synthase subunit B [Fodinicurvata sp. CAU 1616]
MFGSEYFWITVSLIIFLVIAVKMGLAPTLAKLDARSERIRKELEEAQALREEAQKMLADHKRRQREALKDAEEIVEAARSEAKSLRDAAEHELEATIRRREQLAMDKIAQARKNAEAQLRQQAAELAVAAAGRLIASNLDESRQAALTDSSINEVGRKLN